MGPRDTDELLLVEKKDVEQPDDGSSDAENAFDPWHGYEHGIPIW